MSADKRDNNNKITIKKRTIILSLVVVVSLSVLLILSGPISSSLLSLSPIKLNQVQAQQQPSSQPQQPSSQSSSQAEQLHDSSKNAVQAAKTSSCSTDSQCKSGQICDNGACTAPTTSTCSARGQYLSSSGKSCVSSCGANEVPKSGQCTACPKGTSVCASNPDACCTVSASCPKGTCPAAGNTCQSVNTQTDANNCGACGNVCNAAAGETCSAGKCVSGSNSCPTNPQTGATETKCNGTCVDTTSDANNCGACGKVCAAGQTCLSGICKGATLNVVKHVDNTNFGPFDASIFQLTVTGNNPTPSTFSGSESGTTVTLGGGTYSVVETGTGSGYTISYSPDCSGTINPGETKTCTVTNTAHFGKVTVIKHVVGGTASASEFEIGYSYTCDPEFGCSQSGGIRGSESGTDILMVQGTYQIEELPPQYNPPGYTPTYSGDCSGHVDGGETKTCTITNTFNSP